MARPKKNKATEEIGTPPKGTGMPPIMDDENYLFVEDLPRVREEVNMLMKEKQLNPDVVQEDDAGIVFLNGEPHIVIDNHYIPHDEAKIVLQTRKVVREYLKLERMKEELKNKIK